ncbi:MAG: GldG family protein [Firmicutes bacterium]|nr:GldG family protein [Bacillota bacterium]
MNNKGKNNANIKYGGYASVMTVAVVIIAIMVNMVASKLNIKFDLTKNKLYTLSEDTLELLNGLQEDVTLTSVYADGGSIDVVTEILDRYASNSRHVSYSNVDPYKNPQLMAKYGGNGEALSLGSVIVETAAGYRIISQQDIADIYTGQTGESYLRGIKLESILTGAIRQLTSDERKMIYAISGHGESDIYDELITEMEYGGYSLSYLSLITEKTIPDDAVTVVINAPTHDITADELTEINRYLDNGGSLFITLGMTTEDMPNFDSLLENYGLADSRRIVIEGDAGYVYQQNPYYLLPELSADNDVSKRLAEAKTKAFIPFSLAIDILDTKRGTVDVQAFATTSAYSYSKATSEMSNFQKSESDPFGPFVLGATVTDIDSSGNDQGVKIVVFGAETVMEHDINQLVNGGNYGIVMNAFDYLSDSETTQRSKSLGADEYLNMTQDKAIIIMGISVILLPAAILIAGAAVVLRRRNRK